MTHWQALILAIVEGITEYLPISSTGHLILTEHFMTLADPEFAKQFIIIIQFGAILSVIFLYWRRFFAPISFYIKIAVGFLPAAVLGLLVKNHIDRILDSVTIVALSLIVGGVVLAWIDRRSEREKAGDSSSPAAATRPTALNSQKASTADIEQLSYRKAFLIGICQCLAFIPGVSRAASAMIGGLYFGLDRKNAAEFSFFLAVPTLTGATALKVMKIWPTITEEQVSLLLLGNFVSFVVGALAIKTFIKYLSHGSLFGFGIYRIFVGITVLFFV